MFSWFLLVTSLISRNVGTECLSALTPSEATTSIFLPLSFSKTQNDFLQLCSTSDVLLTLGSLIYCPLLVFHSFPKSTSSSLTKETFSVGCRVHLLQQAYVRYLNTQANLRTPHLGLHCNFVLCFYLYSCKESPSSCQTKI